MNHSYLGGIVKIIIVFILAAVVLGVIIVKNRNKKQDLD
jgi:hypothetical protein